MRVLFLFSSEAEFISPIYVHIVLATDTEANSQCFTQLLHCWKHVEALSIQMAFKQVIDWNIMIRGHVNWVIFLI